MLSYLAYDCKRGWEVTVLCFHNKRSEICIKTRSPSASLSFKDQVTEQTTVQWSISHSEILLPNVQFWNFSFPRISGFQTFGKMILQFKRKFFRTMSEIDMLRVFDVDSGRCDFSLTYLACFTSVHLAS